MLNDTVLTLLKKEISENEYQKYIKQLNFDEKASNSDNIVFTTPNQIIANWINRKYKEKIENIYEEQIGKKPNIIIKVKTKKNKTIHIKNYQNSEQQTNNITSTILNPTYTFENFIVGNSNQLAYTIAKSVAQKPSEIYNPVFIYGSSGLGKTHLINAIGNYAIKNNKTVIYTTSEQFLNDYTYHARNQTMDKFRNKYRKCDFLLIDDVQFFSRKEQTQEEFFHTFNELYTNKKQIILTSDKPPKKIAGLEERLQSRFEWGVMADIQPPELETKIEIIKNKCKLDGIDLDIDIINYIASNMGDNIREIESAIITLNAHSNLLNQKITLDFAKDIIKEQIKIKKETITIEDILKTISKELNVKPSDIKSKKRNKSIVEARRICIYLARTLTQNSMPTLANYFDMKDHSAVSHTMRKITQMIEENEDFKIKVNELKNKIVRN